MEEDAGDLRTHLLEIERQPLWIPETAQSEEGGPRGFERRAVLDTERLERAFVLDRCGPTPDACDAQIRGAAQAPQLASPAGVPRCARDLTRSDLLRDGPHRAARRGRGAGAFDGRAACDDEEIGHEIDTRRGNVRARAELRDRLRSLGERLAHGGIARIEARVLEDRLAVLPERPRAD